VLKVHKVLLVLKELKGDKVRRVLKD